jgi:hypothetical protein
MQYDYSAFLELNAEVPEVQSALKSIKLLTRSKDKFLKCLAFEAEPADFEIILSHCNLNIQQTKEEQHEG